VIQRKNEVLYELDCGPYKISPLAHVDHLIENIPDNGGDSLPMEHSEEDFEGELDEIFFQDPELEPERRYPIRPNRVPPAYLNEYKI
jgi:hypothetical protein